MTEVFTQDVLIDGSQDTEQLRVQGHTTQNDALQTWENSSGGVLAQVSGDGRVQVGDDLGMATPDSLVEAHRDSPSTTKPKRGFHSLGRITDTLNAVVAWAVAELELLGTAGISALHSALRVKLTNSNNGTMTSGADLRAGDFEVVNGGGSSPVAKLTAVQAVVTNNSGAAVTDAVGVKVTINNAGTITNPYAIHTDPGGIVHLGDTLEIQRPTAVPGTPSTDLIRIYPKSDGKIYAKNWSGVEFDLTGGGGSGGGVAQEYELGNVVTIESDQQAIWADGVHLLNSSGRLELAAAGASFYVI